MRGKVPEKERPLAREVCPNAGLCVHNKTSRITVSGACPDCGRQVTPKVQHHRMSSSAAARVTQRLYHGGYEG